MSDNAGTSIRTEVTLSPMLNDSTCLYFNFFFFSEWTGLLKEFLKQHIAKLIEMSQLEQSHHLASPPAFSDTSWDATMKYWTYASQLARHMFSVRLITLKF